jgi:hypothetical protein
MSYYNIMQRLKSTPLSTDLSTLLTLFHISYSYQNALEPMFSTKKWCKLWKTGPLLNDRQRGADGCRRARQPDASVTATSLPAVAVLRCRRRIRLSSDETSGSHVNRVTRVNNTRYAVIDSTGDSASGRAEANRASTWANVQFVDPPRKSSQ